MDVDGLFRVVSEHSVGRPESARRRLYGAMLEVAQPTELGDGLDPVLLELDANRRGLTYAREGTSQGVAYGRGIGGAEAPVAPPPGKAVEPRATFVTCPRCGACDQCHGTGLVSASEARS